MEVFFRQTIEEHEEELAEIRRLQELLERLNNREPQIYSITITSNI